MLRKLKRVHGGHELTSHEHEAHMVGCVSNSSSSDRSADLQSGYAPVGFQRGRTSCDWAMASDDAAPSNEDPVALAGDSPMDGPEAFSSGSADSPPFNVFGDRMGRASRGDDATRSMAGALAENVPGQVHGDPPEGVRPPPPAIGLADVLSRGRHRIEGFGDDDAEELQEEDSAGRSERGFGAAEAFEGEASSTTAIPAGTKRRFATIEGRTDASRCAAPRGDRCERHGGHPEGQVEGASAEPDRIIDLDSTNGEEFEFSPAGSPEPTELRGIWAPHEVNVADSTAEIVGSSSAGRRGVWSRRLRSRTGCSPGSDHWSVAGMETEFHQMEQWQD